MYRLSLSVLPSDLGVLEGARCRCPSLTRTLTARCLVVASARDSMLTDEFWQEAGDLSQLHAGPYGPGFFLCTFERTIRRVQKCPDHTFNLLILKSPTWQEILIYSVSEILLSGFC